MDALTDLQPYDDAGDGAESESRSATLPRMVPTLSAPVAKECRTAMILSPSLTVINAWQPHIFYFENSFRHAVAELAAVYDISNLQRHTSAMAGPVFLIIYSIGMNIFTFCRMMDATCT
jgi:hypothetical protein